MNVDFVFEEPFFRHFKSEGDHMSYWRVKGVMKINYNQHIYELNVVASVDKFGEMEADPEYIWHNVREDLYAKFGHWRLASDKNALLIRQIPSMLWKDETLLRDEIKEKMKTYFEKFTSFILEKESAISVPIIKNVVVTKKEEGDFSFDYSIKGRKGTFTSFLYLFYDNEDAYYGWEFSGIEKEGKIVGSNSASYEDHVFVQCVDIIKHLDTSRVRMLTATHEYLWRFPLFQKSLYPIDYSNVKFYNE